MKNKLLELLIFVIFLSLLFNSNIVIEETINAINIFIFTLFPSIFPFFLISDLLINYNFCETLNKAFSKITNFIFHTSNASNFVIIMSILSGFPSGSKYIKTLYDKKFLNENQANYLITFTHFANPLFVLTVTNKLFINKKIPILILITHVAANLLIAFIIRPKEKEIKSNMTNITSKSFSKALESSITSSLNLLKLILGNTIFFFIITGLINNYINLNLIEKIFVNGFFDITKGINTITLLNINELSKGIIILTFLSFGGINIHLQVMNIINNTKIKYKNFLLGRISQMSISIFIFMIIYKIIYG